MHTQNHGCATNAIIMADLINYIELNNYTTHKHIDTHIHMHMYAQEKRSAGRAQDENQVAQPQAKRTKYIANTQNTRSAPPAPIPARIQS